MTSDLQITIHQIQSERSPLCSIVLSGQQLKNPHLAVKHVPVDGGTVAVVQGDYLYYHYMQDGFNDNVRLYVVGGS